MALSKKPYRGTRDFFPEQKRKQDFIFSKMRKTALLFGYEPYDGPLLEETDLYLAKSGEELINNQIYSFEDRGKRNVAIRPEMTPTVARMVAQVHREYPKPIRWFSIPNLMRYEKPQRGRLREHWQFNVDIFGAPNDQGEIEILELATNLLQEFGATQEHFEILYNDRVIVDEVFNNLLGLSDEQSYKLYKIIDQAKKIPFEALKEKVGTLSLDKDKNDIFFNYLKLKDASELLSFLNNNNIKNAAEKFQYFLNNLESRGLTPFVKYDPTIVRGLDYYTGIVFEIFDKHPDNRRAICGGGSYANLLKIFNEEPLPGVGFGLGDVTLTDFLDTHGLIPDFSKPENDIFICSQVNEALEQSLNLATNLRKNGFTVVSHLEPLKFKKALNAAEKKGASFIALLDQQELDEKKVTIKNMVTRETLKASLQDIEGISKFIKNK